MSDGEVKIGDYVLGNCIASGGVSQVWEVTKTGATTSLAMKMLLAEHAKDPAQRALLKYEFKVGSQLEHPNFVKFHEVVVNKTEAYIIMDYFRAPSLKGQMGAGLASLQSRFSKLAEQSCMALHFMHEKGWLHRDVKPENLLFSKSSELRVIDFSLTERAKSLSKLFKAPVIQGTRTYIAPETLLKKKQTARTDMYSLGITFYEILVGSPPFAGTSPADLLKKHVGAKPTAPSELNNNVTPDTDQVILRMLAKKPEKRFDDMQALSAAFRSLKVFHRDPLEVKEESEKKAAEEATVSVDKRLDSRADAGRTAAGIKAPVKPKKKIVAPRGMKKEKKEPKAAPAPAAQQPPPPVPQQPIPHQPMIPQQPMPPGYGQPAAAYPPPMPGQPPMHNPYGMPPQAPMYPQQPMPAQPMPMQQAPMPPGQQMPPGYAHPGVPQQPPTAPPPPQQAVPQQPAPQQPAPQQPPPQPQAVPQQPAAQQPAAQQPSAQQPSAQPPQQQQPPAKATPAPTQPAEPPADGGGMELFMDIDEIDLG